MLYGYFFSFTQWGASIVYAIRKTENGTTTFFDGSGWGGDIRSAFQIHTHSENFEMFLKLAQSLAPKAEVVFVKM